jgi:hypothetical protein
VAAREKVIRVIEKLRALRLTRAADLVLGQHDQAALRAERTFGYAVSRLAAACETCPAQIINACA